MRQIRILIGALAVASVLSVLSIGSAFAAGPETTDGFVCPVLGGQAGGDHGNSSPDRFVTIGGGDTTIIGPSMRSAPVVDRHVTAVLRRTDLTRATSSRGLKGLTT